MVTRNRKSGVLAILLAGLVAVLSACGGSAGEMITGGETSTSPYGYSISQAQQKLDPKKLTSGAMDVPTWTKLQNFQKENKLPITGMLDPATWKALGFDDALLKDQKVKKQANAIKWQPCSTVIIREVNEGLDGSQRWALERVLADISQITGIAFKRNHGVASLPVNPLPVPDKQEITLAWVQPGGSEVMGEDDAASSWLAVRSGWIKGGAGMINIRDKEKLQNFGDGSTYAILLKLMMNLMGTDGVDGIVIRDGSGLSGTISNADIAALQKIYGVPANGECKKK